MLIPLAGGVKAIQVRVTGQVEILIPQRWVIGSVSVRSKHGVRVIESASPGTASPFRQERIDVLPDYLFVRRNLEDPAS